ncbi:SusC/RagA family TonB-linked outer membrane protein [Mucilaginibacter sp. RS28]|uniref:SusC/RagA family TonB-linked outer membrane protein n=1 Tax=Mucilaginibacter straminoryzae TaxID=2932774 RepID=A0A9X1X1F6_9SPHI|nr:SusC/RagA family TonB-linked outer membrane protein [Mucilaginibacter straminoryzae]MCJ8208851.1 SusC/RagA family TonB-linked outer membrane protein [Mucilaginibacter straminoryzae]
MYKIYTIDFVVPKRQLQKTLRIMRWTTLFLLVGLLQVSAASLGQRVTLKKQNASVESVLQEIHRQSGFDIVYDLNVLSKSKPVTIDLKDATVQEALSLTLSGLPLNFEVENKKIVIRQKTFLEKIKDVIPTKVDFRCVVTDSLGNTLPGATAYVKFSKTGYVADSKGEFVVPNVAEAGVVLVVSYLGYQTQEVYFNVRDKSPFKITMKPAMNRLNEVSVIYDGFTKISKERAAGAYSTVDRDQILSTPSPNLLERLVGKMPGVNFDIRSNTIQVRGVNDYTTVGQPLIVVDGFPLISPNDQPRINTALGSVSGNAIINRFNPDDIEQITVLKDASATSIWGSRGANGVIVIETRKGKKGMPVLNVNYTLGVSQRPNLKQLAWMNSSQYIDFEQDLVNRGILTDPALAPSYNALYTANNSDATEWMFRVKRGTATAAQRDAALAELSTHNSRDQINKYLLQNSITHQANISVSGGAENTTYSVSGNYTRNTPFYKNNYGETFYLNSNLSSGLFNRHVIFHTGLNYQYDNSKYNGAAVDALSNSTTSLRPYDNLVDANGNTIQRTFIFRQSIADGLVSKGYLPFSYNALDESNYSNTFSKTNSFRVNAGLTGKFTNWLNADVSVMTQRQVLGVNTINELNSYSNRIQLNTATSVGNNGQLVYGIPYGGNYYEDNNSAYDTGIRGQLNFDHTFKQDHQVTALLGTEIRETGSKESSSTRYGYNQDANTIGVFNPGVSYMTMYGYSQTLSNNLSGISETRRRYLSYYGNAGYSFKDKYFATGSFRFDDATLVGVSRSVRARPFWSTGLRWNATRENFLSNISWLSNLALRASYGISGTIPTTGSNVTLFSVSSNSDSRTGLTTAAINTPANSSLRWSTTKQLNFGTDFSLFRGRFIGSFDIYNKRTDGIVRALPFNPTYGWSSLSYNTAKMTGHGIDLGLTGEIIKLKDFHWSSTFNFTYTTNKITDERFTNLSSNLIAGASSVNGLPVGSLFVYRWAGLDNQGQSQIYDRNGKVISASTSITNFTRDDLRYAGVTYPPYTGGFFNTFTAGPLTATVQMAYYFGNVFMRQSVNTNNYPTSGNSQFYGTIGKVQDMAYRWRQPGDEAKTNIPGIQYASYNSIYRYQYSDALLEKGDHIRLQQVSLSYTVPARLLPKNSIKALSIGANVQNLGIIWRANKDHLDPLFTNTNNYANLPPARNYLLRLNASF